MLYAVGSHRSCGSQQEFRKPPQGGVFTLIGCPPVGRGNFILLKREPGGGATLLAMGRLQQDCETLNLAHIRRLGAELGANEVHLFPAET